MRVARGLAALSQYRREIWRAMAAAAAIGIALALLATTYGVYEQRALGDSRRAPQFAATSGPMTTGLTSQFDELKGAGQFSVVLLQPRGPQSPMPPGVPRLQPGQAVLAPALADYDRAHPETLLSRRYGSVVGTITPDGLGAPDEFLVYAVPETPTKPQQNVSGFGAQPGYSPWQVASSSGIFGESLQINGLVHPFLGVLTLVVIPALLLLVSAAWVSAEDRRRREAVLVALGAPRLLRRGARAVAALPGAIIGAVAGAALVHWWVGRGPQVPLVGSQISGEALPLGRTLAIAVVAALITTTAWIITSRHGALGNRPKAVARRLSPWLVLTAPATVLVAFYASTAARGNGTLFAVVSWASALVCIPAVGLSAAATTSALGTLLRKVGLTRGHSGGVLAGGWLAAQVRHAFVLGLIVAGVTVTAFQGAQAVLTLSEPSAKGLAVSEAIGPDVARVHLTRGSGETWEESLPPGLEAVEIKNSSLVGGCRALTSLGLPCNGPVDLTAVSPRTQRLIQALSLPTSITAVPPPTPTRQARGTFLVVSPTRDPVDLAQIAVVSNRGEGGVARVDRVGADWGSGEGYLIQARWVTVLTVAGMTSAMIAAFLIAMRSAADLTRALAGPVALFAPRRRSVGASVSFCIAAPFVIAGVFASSAALVLAVPVLRKIAASGALDQLAMVVLGLCLLTGLLAAATTALLLRGASARWLPGRGS